MVRGGEEIDEKENRESCRDIRHRIWRVSLLFLIPSYAERLSVAGSLHNSYAKKVSEAGLAYDGRYVFSVAIVYRGEGWVYNEKNSRRSIACVKELQRHVYI